MATGTNPFAKNFGGSPQPQRPVTSAGPLAPQHTGTNPFRQGAFVNHQTGLGWQHSQQTMGGGLDQLGARHTRSHHHVKATEWHINDEVLRLSAKD
ncbi:hypothetical protein HYQ46_000434 [Verticillium longisporum]|nr:hypothetical protein HYQ46_000434 [Verticillium longisporum]